MRWNRLRSGLAAVTVLASTFYLFGLNGPGPALAVGSATSGPADTSPAAATTATPIKHLVVLFDENISFDHYFATYPNAANPPNEPPFTAKANTPTVNGLNDALLTHNPNSQPPLRLSRTQALTCDQGHGYTAEQKAVDNGLLDKFVESVQGKAGNSAQYCPNGIVMDYYDGNTVTGMWNYAQNFAMNDNSYNTVFGPSTPGALNLIAADTAGTNCGPSSAVFNSSPCTLSAPATAPGAGTDYSDADPYYDDCSAGGTADKSKTIAQGGKNIGDVLNASNITWGWFQGGFDNCTVKHSVLAYDALVGTNPATDPNGSITDYNPHHEPFQYYASTSNPHHLRPTSTAMIGQTDQANHQYDLTDFWAAANAGNLPAVSFLKAPNYEDGHAGYSDPLDEQNFVVNTINGLEALSSWTSTAVIIGYDDSDGWYDHLTGPIVNHSNTSLDVNCGATSTGPAARCGYGPRLPYIVISPWSRTNFVDNTLTDQTSTIRFIEDNWLGGQRMSATSFDNEAGTIMHMFDFDHPALNGHKLFLDPTTGEPVQGQGNSLGAPYFVVAFNSKNPGTGTVNFGTSCNGLVMTATADSGAGKTSHYVTVTGNDLPGTVGNIGITPGTTYYYETISTSTAGREVNNNNGQCFQVTIPAR
jgi:phospholipase C